MAPCFDWRLRPVCNRDCTMRALADSLSVWQNGTGRLSADSIWGVLRALETFSQLIFCPYLGTVTFLLSTANCRQQLQASLFCCSLVSLFCSLLVSHSHGDRQRLASFLVQRDPVGHVAAFPARQSDSRDDSKWRGVIFGRARGCRSGAEQMARKEGKAREGKGRE